MTGLIRNVALCALAAVLLTGASDYLRTTHSVFINGKPFGDAEMVGGVWAISLDDFRKNVDGTLVVSGNNLKVARDPQSGLPTGKRMHKPFVITKEVDHASPLIMSAGKPFIAVTDLARLFGGSATLPAKLAPGATISLNFTRNANAAIHWGD